MSDAERYEKEFEQLQPYVPFLREVIAKGGGGNTVQLQKVRTLLELITNRNRLTLEHIPKCLKALEVLHLRMAGLASSKISTPHSDKIAVKIEKIDNLMSKAKVRETPDSPPPYQRSEPNDTPVVIPTERLDGRDSKPDNKEKMVDRRHRDSPSSRSFESADRGRYQSKNDTRRSRWDVSIKSEPSDTRPNESRSSYRSSASTSTERSDPNKVFSDKREGSRSAIDAPRSSKDRDERLFESNRHDRHDHSRNDRHSQASRHSETHRSIDRYQDGSRSVDRSSDSRLPSDRSSDPRLQSDRSVDPRRSSDLPVDPRRSSDRQESPRQSSFPAPSNKSVFNRLGEKIPPKKYTNLNICVNKNDPISRNMKVVDKSNVPISVDEMNEIHQDNVGRFGECSRSDIDLNNLNELTKQRNILLREIEKTVKLTGNPTPSERSVSRPALLPQPLPSKPTATPSTSQPVKHALSSDPVLPAPSPKIDSLNLSLFHSANAFHADRPKNNEKSLSDILQRSIQKPNVHDPLLPDPAVSNQSKPSYAGKNSLVDMVKVAISVSTTDPNPYQSPDQAPLSPTALKAVKHYISGMKTPLLPTPGTQNNYWEDNFDHQNCPPQSDEPHRIPLLEDPRPEEPRLALKYNPKPRRSHTNVSSSMASHPVDSAVRNRDPRMKSLELNESPSYESPQSHPSPTMHGNTQHMQHFNPPHFNQSHYGQPHMGPTNGPHNQFFPDRPNFNQNRPPWMQFEIAEAPPKTYGEYRKAKEQQQKLAQQKLIKKSNTVSTPNANESTSSKIVNSNADTSPPFDDATSPNSTVPLTASNIARSQFDNIYRVNNYEQTANQVTSMNSEISQNFKIPKKKTTSDDKATKPVLEEPAPIVSQNETVKEPVSGSRDPRKTNRDPRRNRATRIYDTSESETESITEPSIEPAASRSPNCEVSSSQPSKTDEPDKEVLNNNILQMLGKVVDEERLKQIRRIIEMDNKDASNEPTSPSSSNQEVSDALPDDITMPSDDDSEAAPYETRALPSSRKKTKAKRKNELQKLNEDIRDMFISSSVVNATGRRACTISNAEASVKAEAIVKLIDSPAPEDKPIPVPARITRRRVTMGASLIDAEPLQPLRSFSPLKRTKKARAASDGEADEDDEPLSHQRLSQKKGRKSAPLFRSKTPLPRKKATKTPEPEPPVEPEPPKRTLRSNNPTVVLKKLTSQELAASCLLPTVTAKSPAAATAKSPVTTSAKSPAKATAKSPVAITAKSPANATAKSTATGTNKSAATDGDKLPATDGAKLPATVNAKPPTTAVAAPPMTPTANSPAPLDLIESLILKNTNVEMYASNILHAKKCLLCNFQGLHMVNHYAFAHPNAENYLARIPVDNALLVRSGKLEEAERTGNNFKQICVFCNLTKNATRQSWAFHLMTHTGECVYACNVCDLKQTHSKIETAHRERCPNAKMTKKTMPYTLDLLGYMCTLCNFTKFDRDSVLRHLTNQHSESNAADKILNVPFLRIIPKPNQIAAGSSRRKSDAKLKSTVASKVSKKRAENQKDTSDDDQSSSDENATTDEVEEPPLLKPELPVDNQNAFLAQPKQEDGLFDKDTMRIMNDMSFSNGNTTPVTPPRSIGTSMADRLNERFKSAQKDAERIVTKDSPKSPYSLEGPRRAIEFDMVHPSTRSNINQLVEEFEHAKSLCDDIIAIENKRPEENVTTDVAVTNRVPEPEKTVLKEDDDDDSWESCSDDGSVGDIVENTIITKEETDLPINSEIPAANCPVKPQPPPTHPAPSATPPIIITTTKNNLIHDTVNRLFKSVNANTNSFVPPSLATCPNLPVPKPSLTQQSAPATKASISVQQKIDTLPPTTTLVPKSIPLRVPAQSVKTINRIDNVGYSIWNKMTAFCCLIDGCGYETTYLSNLSAHSVNHTVLWTGYCFVCDIQISETPTHLKNEITHMQTKHIDTKDVPTPAKILEKPAEKPVLKVRRLSGDTLSKSTLSTQLPQSSGPTQQLPSFGPIQQTQSSGPIQKPISSGPFQQPQSSGTTRKPPSNGLQIVKVHSLAPSIPLEPPSAGSPPKGLITNPVPSSPSTSPNNTPAIKITNVMSLNSAVTGPLLPSSTTPIPVQITVKLAPSTNAPQMDIHMLKPFTTHKSAEICSTMLKNTCLFSLYKCMATDCSFSNSSPEMMYQHLRYHEAYSSLVQASWLDCAYCDEKITSCEQLVAHTYDEHFTSKFQCPYCFYRSCAAHNVLLHIGKMHKPRNSYVLVCHGNTKKTHLELPYMLESRAANVKPIQCNACPSQFFIMESFVRHMVSSHNEDSFMCSYCTPKRKISFGTMVKHLLSHNIGIFQCIYCEYAIDEIDGIREHLFSKHPSKLLYIACRVRQKDKPHLTKDSLESTVISYIGESVDTRVLSRCPYPDSQLSQASESVRKTNFSLSKSSIVFKKPPNEALVAEANEKVSMEDVVNVIDVKNYYVTNFDHIVSARSAFSQPTKNLVISQVFSGSKTSTATSPTAITNKTSTTVGAAAIQVIPLISNPSTKIRIAHVPTIQVPPVALETPVAISKTAARSETVSPGVKSNGFPGLPSHLTKKATVTPRPELLQREIDQAAKELLSGLGFEGTQLYRCAVPGCGGTGTDPKHFNVHMIKHNNEPDSANGFRCFHCAFVSKNIVGLKYHMKEHGSHRLFCFYCDHTGPILNLMLKHMNDTHKKNTLVTLPLNPKRTDQNTDTFVICPRGVRQDELNRFVMGLIDRFKMKVKETKKVFTPDEIDLIPRQAIMPHLISCGNCNYSTKVRTNMTRHLAACKTQKIDSNATTQPRSDPVNPVPCLDTGELHFDKMRNLACSSSFGPTTGEDVFAFIPENKRFVCNAKSCHYQSLTESGLRSHLSTLHQNELNYECSHCSTNLGNMNVDRIINHLRMHDSRIFRCSKCSFNHFSRQTVDKHIADAHPGSMDACPTLIVRASDDSRVSYQSGMSITAATNAPTNPPVNIIYKWRCSLCPNMYATRGLVVAHVHNAHSILHQYQCSICNEMQSNAKAAIIEHMNSKHPGGHKVVKYFYTRVEINEAEENTPIWRRDENKVKHIRGILLDDDQSAKSKRKNAANVSNKPQFGILSVTGDAIMSGPVATYTDAPDTDDESIDVVHPDAAEQVCVIVSDEEDQSAKVIAQPPRKRQRRESICVTNKIKRPAFTKVKDKKIGCNIPIELGLSVELFRCDQCEFTCESNEILYAHSLKVHSSKLKPLQAILNNQIDTYNRSTLSQSIADTFKCSYCSFTSDSVNTLKNHHTVSHGKLQFRTVVNAQIAPEQPRPIVIGVQTTAELINDDQAFVYTCKYCPKREDTVDVMYRHWQQMHKYLRPIANPNASSPPTSPVVLSTKKFSFGIDLNVRCAKCSNRISYRQMRGHFLRAHPEGPCACLHILDPKKCGICGWRSADADELDAHFAESHPLVPVEDTTILDRPIVSISESTLRNIQYSGHRGVHKCLYCGDAFEYIEDFEKHHKDAHPNSPHLVEVKPAPTRFGCTICDFEYDTVVEVVQHLQHHNLYKFQKKYQCIWCPEMRRTKIEVREHQLAAHSTDSRGWCLTAIETRMDVYNRIKVLFPNGLCVFKSELKETKWGDMTEIEIELNRLEMEEVLAETSSERGSKRKHSADDSDSTTSSRSSKVSKPSEQRKQMAKRSSRTPMVKLEVEEPVPEGSKQTLVSHYGIPPEPVDLRRISTYMQFGGNKIKITCDRFAMMVDINPKLQLVPVSLSDYPHLCE